MLDLPADATRAQLLEALKDQVVGKAECVGRFHNWRERAMVRMRATLWAPIVLALLAGSAPVHGHHSFAMFDTTSQVTLNGVVTSFEWTNPHAYIEVDVSDGRDTKHWTIELGSTSILMRGGWKFNTLKHGDKIVAVVNPLRNGEPGSLLSRITLPDGRVLGNGGPPPGGTPAPAATGTGAAPAAGSPR